MKTRLQKIFQRKYALPEELLFEKVCLAQEIFENYGEYFLRLKDFVELLKKYEKAIEISNKRMDEFKSFSECHVCTVLEGKGCCKAGLENEATVAIILLNFLLKKELPKEREVPGRCFFVGPVGCKLFARPSLCREFFCRRLLDTFKQEEYVSITQAVAEELTLQGVLVRYIKKELEFLTGEFLYELDITGYSSPGGK